MGEIADAILDGVLCEVCGVFVDSEPDGFPRRCAHCSHDEDADEEFE